MFNSDDYIYGVRGRCNVGFGLWQLAWGSKQALTPEDYEIARAALAGMRGDNGRKLGIQGTHLLVPAQLEGNGRRILKNQLTTTGGSNPWIDSAELVVSPWSIESPAFPCAWRKNYADLPPEKANPHLAP